MFLFRVWIKSLDLGDRQEIALVTGTENGQVNDNEPQQKDGCHESVLFNMTVWFNN